MGTNITGEVSSDRLTSCSGNDESHLHVYGKCHVNRRLAMTFWMNERMNEVGTYSYMWEPYRPPGWKRQIYVELHHSRIKGFSPLLFTKDGNPENLEEKAAPAFTDLLPLSWKSGRPVLSQTNEKQGKCSALFLPCFVHSTCWSTAKINLWPQLIAGETV